VIGIDLGTTNACVAVVESGVPMVIPNSQGQTLLPAVVAIAEQGKRIVGHMARRQSVLLSEHTASSLKRLIGRKFGSQAVRQMLDMVGYKITAGQADEVYVSLRGESVPVTELYSALVGELKRTAEQYLHETVTKAVFTVPVNFTDAQRHALKEAGQRAGLEVLRIVHEATAAGIAYGSLMVTDFRGFNQFGLIGGAGMVLVWICTMLLVPPIILIGERLRPGVFTPKENLWRYPFAVLGGLVQRRPVVFAGLSAVVLAVALVPLGRYLKDPLEWDLNNLRSDETQAQRLWGKMEEMGMGNVGAGYIGNTGVLLVDTPEQAEPVAEAIRKKDAALGPAHVLAAVRTIHSVLPPKQDEKLAILGRIRQKIDRYRELMSEDEWRDIAGFRPPEYLRRLTPDDLPRIVREAFTETDDTRGRLIGMDANYANYQDWNGHDLLRLAEALRVEALGKTWVAASAGTVFGGMIETIHRDGPQVTLVALVGVLGLVVMMFGVRGAVPVILALALGIMWLGGMLGYLHLKLNFMNFVTLPITLGVGADYAANIWARLRDEGPGQIREVIATTGSAVVLCSTTTMIGYSTLLLANNRALRSFGLAADIGEITCLLAALIFMPVLVRAFWRHRAGSASR